MSNRSSDQMTIQNATSSASLQHSCTLPCHVYYRSNEQYHSSRSRSVLLSSPWLSQFRINGLLRFPQVFGRSWASRVRDSCPNWSMHKLMRIHFSRKYCFMKYVVTCVSHPLCFHLSLTEDLQKKLTHANRRYTTHDVDIGGSTAYGKYYLLSPYEKTECSRLIILRLEKLSSFVGSADIAWIWGLAFRSFGAGAQRRYDFLSRVRHRRCTSAKCSWFSDSWALFGSFAWQLANERITGINADGSLNMA